MQRSPLFGINCSNNIYFQDIFPDAIVGIILDFRPHDETRLPFQLLFDVKRKGLLSRALILLKNTLSPSISTSHGISKGDDSFQKAFFSRRHLRVEYYCCYYRAERPILKWFDFENDICDIRVDSCPRCQKQTPKIYYDLYVMDDRHYYDSESEDFDWEKEYPNFYDVAVYTIDDRRCYDSETGYSLGEAYFRKGAEFEGKESRDKVNYYADSDSDAEEHDLCPIEERDYYYSTSDSEEDDSENTTDSDDTSDSEDSDLEKTDLEERDSEESNSEESNSEESDSEKSNSEENDSGESDSEESDLDEDGEDLPEDEDEQVNIKRKRDSQINNDACVPPQRKRWRTS